MKVDLMEPISSRFLFMYNVPDPLSSFESRPFEARLFEARGFEARLFEARLFEARGFEARLLLDPRVLLLCCPGLLPLESRVERSLEPRVLLLLWREPALESRVAFRFFCAVEA